MLELFKKYRSRILLGLMLFVSLLVYSAYLRHSERPSTIEQRMLSLLAPVQQTTELTRSGGTAIWTRLFGASAAETARLQAENLRLKTQLVEREEALLENLRLQSLLDFSTQLENRPLVARVIAVDATSWFRTVTIDRGSGDGLKEGMAVITDQGVAGRIITCSSGSARVLLIVDTSSHISSLIERTRARGVCRGTGELLTLDYVPLTEDVQNGDILVTSGLGGGFPKGLVIGTVSAVARRGFDMFQTISIEPAVDFSRLEEVLVITSSERSTEPLRKLGNTPARP